MKEICIRLQNELSVYNELHSNVELEAHQSLMGEIEKDKKNNKQDKSFKNKKEFSSSAVRRGPDGQNETKLKSLISPVVKRR